jgi:SPP1 gp7 family putative phage head morphogenesis protein
MTQILFGPVPHRAASDFIKDKPAVSREVFERMVPEVRARTFLVSGMVPLDIAQKLRDRIADLPAGADWDKIKGEVAESLSPYLAPDPGAKNDEGNPMSGAEREAAARAAAERRSELLLRTHGYQAYAASQYEVMQRQTDVFPYWRYQTAQDDRVRDSHAALEGVVLPANDPFWQTHFPPWDFNCRCTVVPLSDADFAEIREDDQQKPVDQRSILSPEQRSRMNNDGTLLRGPNQVVDVRSPRQKRDGDGYAWQPGDLRLPLSTIKERYSPEVWSAFESFAKATRIEGSQTIHSWLEGAPAVARPSTPPGATPRTGRTSRRPDPEPSPEPAAAVPAEPGVPVRQSPVSRVFKLQASRTSARPAMAAALAAVDRVHDDGALPEMTLISRPVPRANGHFDARNREIAVRPSGPWPQMTASHEIGHMLDFFVLGSAGRFASESHPDLGPWREAVAKSRAIQQILAGQVGGKAIYKAGYLQSPREIWARAYAQYVATKSGDPELLRQLDIIRKVPDFGAVIQWSDEDFAPISAAMDEVFRKKGWIA